MEELNKCISSIGDKNRLELESIVRSMVGDKLEKLLQYLFVNNFYTSPAAKSYHENYPGGLYDHCKEVFSQLFEYRTKMNKNWSDLELILIAFGHDLCKLGLYIMNYNNGTITYSLNPIIDIAKHGTRSLEVLSELVPELLNERIANSIVCHMGLWTADVPNISDYMRDAQSKDDLVFFTHSADMVASRLGKIANRVFIDDGELKIT